MLIYSPNLIWRPSAILEKSSSLFLTPFSRVLIINRCSAALGSCLSYPGYHQLALITLNFKRDGFLKEGGHFVLLIRKLNTQNSPWEPG